MKTHHEDLGSELMENDVRVQLSDKRTQPLLILVFLLGTKLWRWRVGWGQVRTSRRLNPRAAGVGWVIGGDDLALSKQAFGMTWKVHRIVQHPGDFDAFILHSKQDGMTAS